MIKKITVFVFSIILMSTVSAYAMHCHSTNDDHNDTMTEHMEQGMGNDSGHGHEQGAHGTGDGHHMDQSRTGTHSMDEKTMRNAVGKYMSKKGITAYHIGGIKDNNTHYRADVHNHSGDLLDKLRIDKKTGKIHSLKEE